MWRSAVAERVEKEAEAFLRLSLFDSDCPEHLALHLRVADTDRSATNFPSVPDDVIRLRPSRPRICRVELAVRRGEGVVERVPAVPLGVPAEQRPVDDPGEFVRPRIDQAKALGEATTQFAEHRARAEGLVRDDQQYVALAGAQLPVRRRDLAGREELRDRRAPAVALDDGPDEALGAQLGRLRDQAVEVGARHLAAADVQTPDHGPALDRLLEGV